jgi:flotillin
MFYSISEPSEYLAITGAGIPNVRITKKAFVWPLQRVQRISITPFDFSLNLQAMTVEKLQFSLPAVFTIGPEYNMEALQKYALLLTGPSRRGGGGANGKGKAAAQSGAGTAASAGTGNNSGGRNHVQDIVKGIIEGETRVIVSSMTMEEIFKERQIFKRKVIQNVQSELDQFGLRMLVLFTSPPFSSISSIGNSPWFTFFFRLSLWLTALVHCCSS